jgi:hypothetical protein
MQLLLELPPPTLFTLVKDLLLDSGHWDILNQAAILTVYYRFSFPILLRDSLTRFGGMFFGVIR